jgi:hypothetical protein
MDALTYTSYTAVDLASQSRARLQTAVAVAHRNPAPGSFAAVQQAESQVNSAALVLDHTISSAKRMNADLTTLVDQQAGVGQNMDLYA